MKKQLVSVLCGAAAVAMAVPALAASEISGQFRLQGAVDNVQLAKDAPDNQWITQRMRAKWTNKINDYVTVVWHGEIDATWGDADTGGGPGTDGKVLETKWAYAALKVPAQGLDMTVTTGLQAFKDNFQNSYIYEDVAAGIVASKFGTVGVNVGYSKLFEGKKNAGDDLDLYILQANVAPNENMKFGADLYWEHDQAGDNAYKSDLYTIGLYGNANKLAGIVNVDGFLAFQTGKQGIDSDAELDYTGLALSVAAGAKFNDNLGASLRVLYYGNASKDDALPWQGAGSAKANGCGGLAFSDSNMFIFLSNYYKLGGYRDQVALDAVTEGYGLIGFVANVDFTKDIFFAKAGLGYFMTASDKAFDNDDSKLDKTDLGLEISAQVGAKIADVYTVSLKGSYAVVGGAFDKSIDKSTYDPDTGELVGDAKFEDPDNMYVVTLGVDIPF